jgi:hypothetical protein
VTVFSLVALAGCAGEEDDDEGSEGGSSSESFDTTAVGAIPAGWDVVTGTWKVEASAQARSAPNLIRQSATDQEYTVLLDDGAGEYTDLQATVKFYIDGGVTQKGAGIAFRYNEAGAHYVVRYNHAELAWHLFRFTNAVDKQKIDAATVDGSAQYGGFQKWITLVVNMEGQRIVAYADGHKVIDYTDTDPAGSKEGHVGIWGRGDTIAMFDDFHVNPL